MMKGERSYEHGHKGAHHHDEHIGGNGSTHMANAVRHLNSEGADSPNTTPHPKVEGGGGSNRFSHKRDSPGV